jgi:DNA-binding response OmpR family regulator
MAMTTLLLVEDDFDVAQNICAYLESAAFEVEWAPNGLLGLESATRGAHDLLILDIALPGLSGVDLCARLRALGFSALPIIMLTARGELESKLTAFDAGADDYLVKPFALEELRSRIQALLRRTGNQSSLRVLRVGDLELNVATQTVRRAGRPLAVTATGRKVLEVLMRNPHRVVSRAELEQAVWGDSPPESDALRIHIHGLREVIDKPFERPLLVTVRGSGYRITDDDPNR